MKSRSKWMEAEVRITFEGREMLSQLRITIWRQVDIDVMVLQMIWWPLDAYIVVCISVWSSRGAYTIVSIMIWKSRIIFYFIFSTWFEDRGMLTLLLSPWFESYRMLYVDYLMTWRSRDVYYSFVFNMIWRLIDTHDVVFAIICRMRVAHDIVFTMIWKSRDACDVVPRWFKLGVIYSPWTCGMLAARLSCACQMLVACLWYASYSTCTQSHTD